MLNIFKHVYCVYCFLLIYKIKFKFKNIYNFYLINNNWSKIEQVKNIFKKYI